MNMKISPVKFQGVLTSFASRKDKSLRLTISTGELTRNENMALQDLQDVAADILMAPYDVPESEVVVVKGSIEFKSPSQRLRGVLYVLFQKLGIPGDFETFYRVQIEKYIDRIKEQIEAVE